MEVILLIICLIIFIFLWFQHKKENIQDWKITKKQHLEQLKLLENFIENKTNEINNLREQYDKYVKLIEDYEQKTQDLQHNFIKYNNIILSINKDIENYYKEKQQDMLYRMYIKDQDKTDIKYLISILPNLRNPTILNKLIWSEYLINSFNDMIKKSYGNKTYKNVIYCITNIENNQRYIGKTKGEVQKRWIEHIKSSLDIGTIKSSQIHKALFNNWDNFKFTILEVVPLDQNLSEREKFYIDFYKTNVYGYNMKAGG